MSAFTRVQRRFLCQGLQLTRAADNVDPGKFPILRNVRSVVQGAIQARDGLTLVPTSAFGAPVHTVTRFDDASPFAGQAHLYVIGAGANLYAGPLNGPFPQIDTGYSGNPLSLVDAVPPQSPQPFVYIADSARMRKTDSNGNVYGVGIYPPTGEPSSALQQLGSDIIDRFAPSGNLWMAVGPTAVIVGPIQRVNTQIVDILYDSGNTGYASIHPLSMDSINEGILLQMTASLETFIVTETTIAVATTTVQAILYDSGTTGLCTIQPAGSLGTGQLSAPTYQDYVSRYGGAFLLNPGEPFGAITGSGFFETPGSPPPAPTGRSISQVDFPVNCLVQIGTEVVRILSVAVGRDETLSFRCRTTGTHGAGETITGLPGFRAYLTGTYGAATQFIDGALVVAVKTVAPNPNPKDVLPSGIGGIRTSAGWAPRNLAQINGRATLPDDEFRLAVKIDLCTEVQTVRLYLSLEPTAGTTPSATDDFTANYYFFEWRQSDIATAIQSQNADPVSSILAARGTVIQPASVTNQPIQSASGTGPGSNAISQALAIGNNQWITLKCRVGQLTRVGTDTSKTLANITAAEILLNVVGPAQVEIAFDSLILTGGFGPDTGIGPPYVYRYRYRSSLTGAVSNPSPATRGGVIPQRQSVLLTGAQSSDSQVDLVDWFKQGGTINRWTYTGTSSNTNPPTFLDVDADSSITGGDTLEFDNFPPFPTQDLPRTGTCNVAGSAVLRVSGSAFNTSWQPGSIIVINQQAYTLYAAPSNSNFLFINENAGALTGVPFTVTGPTLIGQNFGSVWGGPIAGSTFLFGCQNPIDPGMVSWTKGNNPEQASDKNTLQVTTPADPLQAGFMWDGVSFVASTQELFVLEPTQSPDFPFRPLVTPCGRGFWTPWAFCIAPEGVYFLAKDGIFLTSGGSPAVSITDLDLYPLFPHEGVVGQPVNGYAQVDMSQTTALRLAYADGWVIFDYKDTNGDFHTLSYRTADKSWWPDTLTPGASVHESAVGRSIHQILIGGQTGHLYTQAGFTDAGSSISCEAMVVDNQGDARRFKLYRDVFLKANLGGGSGVVTVGVIDNTVTLPPVTLSGSSLLDYVIDTVPQMGIYGTNLTVDIAWSPASVTNPIWEVLDLAYQLEPELASSWLSGPTTFGFRGFMQIQRALIAYLSTGPVTLSLIVDGVVYTYNLPSTGGQYAKNQVILQSVKGKTWQLGMQGAVFLLFDKDCEFWCQPWGQGGGYQTVRAF